MDGALEHTRRYMLRACERYAESGRAQGVSRLAINTLAPTLASNA